MSGAGADAATLNRVAAWLNSIGLVAEPGKRSDQSFMRGIWLDLAIIPSRFRYFVKGDIEESLAPHYDAYFNLAVVRDAEDQTLQAIIQSGDVEAIAWSYAASLACGIDPWLCFVNGFGDEARSVFEAMKLGCGQGINGLRASGMLTTVRDFPKLNRWLQA